MLAGPWKTHCTGLNLSEKGSWSVDFAKSTQISVRPGQQVCASTLTPGFGTLAEAMVCYNTGQGCASLGWALCQ